MNYSESSRMHPKRLHVKLFNGSVKNLLLVDLQPYDSFIQEIFGVACDRNRYVYFYQWDLKELEAFMIFDSENAEDQKLKMLHGKYFTEELYHELKSDVYSEESMLDCILTITIDINQPRETK